MEAIRGKDSIPYSQVKKHCVTPSEHYQGNKKSKSINSRFQAKGT